MKGGSAKGKENTYPCHGPIYIAGMGLLIKSIEKHQRSNQQQNRTNILYHPLPSYG